MKVLFIALHRPDRSPSQRFRFEQYIPFLEENGIQCELSHLVDEREDRVLYEPGKWIVKAALLIKSYRRRMADVRRADDFDIIFVQREAFMTGTTVFERQFAKSRAKLVFDFDDSIWLENVSMANRNLNFLKRPQKTLSIIQMADHVVAGNAYLADYARQFNSNITIIPTTIDTEGLHNPALHPARTGDGVTIGWTGSHSTLKYLGIVAPVLRDIQTRYTGKVQFRVIADLKPALDFEFEFVPWSKATETTALRQMDIGIMPLPDDEWAKGKCGFKALQYMAMEIPCVASPVGVNSEIIHHGENGLLAATESEWNTALTTLIEDAALRKTLGKNGRKTVVEHYSVEANKQKYLDVLNTAMAKSRIENRK